MFDIILPNLDTRPEDKTWQKISRVDHKSTIQSFQYIKTIYKFRYKEYPKDDNVLSFLDGEKRKK